MEEKLKEKLIESSEGPIKKVLNPIANEVGNTFSDIWFLAIGGFTHHKVERRLVEYEADLEKHKAEIEKDIADIPKENLCDADMQIIGKILEKSKYCADKQKIRKIFAKMVAASMDNRKKKFVSPYLIDLLGNMSENDVVCFLFVATGNCYLGGFDDNKIADMTDEDIRQSFVILSHLGLISWNGGVVDINQRDIDDDDYMHRCKITELGEKLYSLCV